MRLPVSRWPLLVLPTLLFVAFFHWQMLDIGNAGWLIRGTDNGENALGLHAWLHDPAPSLLKTWLLGGPEGVSLLFTDSNPLIAMLARPFAALLPPDAQFVGPWLLLCLFLQIGFAWRLLRDHAPNPVALWGGVLLLAALPTLFNRFVHANLFAHWLILWAIWRFLDEERSGRNIGWAVLIAITALIHSYLLVMVGAIWASAMLRRFALERGWGQRFRTVCECIAILLLVAGIAWILGVGVPHHSFGNYGAFAMPLDALWNPGTPAYSAFLPAIPQQPGRGFEGFQYLGLGLLILLPVAALLSRFFPASGAEADDLERLKWLVPALVVLTLLAVSNYPDFAGHKLPRFPLPEVTSHLDAIRASGRLFWPVSYVLVLIAIRVVYRLPGERSALLLGAFLAVQIADMTPMAASIRAQTADATQDRLYVRTADPRWAGLVARARDVAFMPGNVTRDLALFQEVAWRAIDLRRPVRNVYAARASLAAEARLLRDRRAFQHGVLAPDRLYILGPHIAVPPTARQRMMVLDGVRVLAPVTSR
ncbi:hypothetical protein GCM10023219_18230 [Stakelama sediminis]|uniref:4-amino-4-deoxy-L-arabinose transferase-like glycosyltransferase n=1 Tax=Stakelama sediminis TaxID=463200 RepID=A0A840Z122_9SPHN|nr:DUF6311 domain-containing protein [Stakelama sediminis]MBB5719831.1 hypothetical protein [Stakelama sediminis]